VSSFAQAYLEEAAAVMAAIDRDAVERVALGLARVRDAGGRLFVLGLGGSAASAAHAVNDFRKLCGFEAYAPTDNVAELTARVNDEGWDAALAGWLEASRLRAGDAVLALSVGGGDREAGVSTGLVSALELAGRVGAAIHGIVGRDGGATGRLADAAVLVPPLFPERVTPHTEALCAVVLHLLVSHPRLRRSAARWESLAAGVVAR
jgi:D-sedoheptulose 7-phosphate isomerase